MKIKEMLSHKKSLDILKKTDALLEGHFVLSSGLHSSKYIQCAKLLSFPVLAEKICKSLANKIKKKYKNIDLILSPAMGGVIIGYEIGKLLKNIYIDSALKKSSKADEEFEKTKEPVREGKVLSYSQFKKMNH